MKLFTVQIKGNIAPSMGKFTSKTFYKFDRM